MSLNSKVIKTETYGAPPVVQQRAGNSPLGEADGEPVIPAPLNSNDDRMNQTVYVNGQIYGALNTVIQNKNGSHPAWESPGSRSDRQPAIISTAG